MEWGSRRDGVGGSRGRVWGSMGVVVGWSRRSGVGVVGVEYGVVWV